MVVPECDLRPDDRVLVLPDVEAVSLLYEDPGAERAALAAVPFERACALLEDVAEAIITKYLRSPGPLVHA